MTLYTPLWAQNAAYPARLDRQFIDAAFGPPRVVNDLTVSPRAEGANMSVDIDAGRVVMPGPSGNYLGYSDAIENRSIGAAPASGTSRYDLVVAQVYDPQAIGTGTDIEWDIEVVPGTASSNPSEPSVPAWATPLARVFVTDSTVSITDTAILDRRPLSGYVASIGRSGDTSTSSSVTVPTDGVRRSAFTLTEDRSVEVGISGNLMRTSNAGIARAAVFVDGVEAARISMHLSVLGGPGTAAQTGVKPLTLAAGNHSIHVVLSSVTGGSHAWITGGWRAWVRDVGPDADWID